MKSRTATENGVTPHCRFNSQFCPRFLDKLFHVQYIVHEEKYNERRHLHRFKAEFEDLHGQSYSG
jgi:hypothetical protein